MSDWSTRVGELRDLASDAIDRGDHEEALARIGEAFAIVDADGTQQDPTFVSLLCVAADLAAMSEELDSARSLYMRAHQLGRSVQVDGALLAKALVGIGSLAEADDDTAKAAEHYREALAALDGSTHEDAELARAAIADALERVSRS